MHLTTWRSKKAKWFHDVKRAYSKLCAALKLSMNENQSSFDIECLLFIAEARQENIYRFVIFFYCWKTVQNDLQKKIHIRSHMEGAKNNI